MDSKIAKIIMSADLQAKLVEIAFPSGIELHSRIVELTTKDVRKLRKYYFAFYGARLRTVAFEDDGAIFQVKLYLRQSDAEIRAYLDLGKFRSE